MTRNGVGRAYPPKNRAKYGMIGVSVIDIGISMYTVHSEHYLECAVM